MGEFQANGVPVIRGGDIREGRIVCDDAKRVSREVSEQFRRTILRGGEIVINLISEPGHCAIVPPDFAGANVSRDVGVIPVLPEVSCDYIDYFLKSPQCVSWFEARLQGSVTQKINLSTLKSAPVPLPPLAQQRRIAGVLRALDDKIELNRQTNETLEAMTWALFKSWFIDFDPVRAKMEGCSPSCMDAATAASFPDSLCKTEGVFHPTGWRTLSFDEEVSFLNGLALQKFPVAEGEPFLPVIKIAQIRAGNSEGADRASLSVPLSHRIDDGDLIFSWSGSLMVRLWVGGPGALNQHLFKVTSATFPRWFIHGWLQHHLPGFQAIAADKATTMGHIQRHHLSEAKIVAPSADVFERANRLIAPLEEQVIQNDKESRTLRELRDQLLPRLFSGELRVREVERVVEAAV